MSSRLTQSIEEILDIDSIAADIQRGIFKSPSFFGDTDLTKMFEGFINGAATSSTYAGAATLKNSLVDTRDPEDTFKFTKDEYNEIQKRTNSIAAYGNIPSDVVEDFLLILCYVDKLSDMTIIGEALDLPKLINEKILRNPLAILSIPNLEKIVYMSSAVEGLTKMFSQFSNTPNIINNSADGESMIDIMGSIVSGFGGASFGNLFSGTAPEELAGNFLSELITGSRIPMSVIAKNPMQQLPSYIGKAFFGENATSLSLVDIEQIFNKKIGVFPKPSAGAGTSAFGLQNLMSFSNDMSVENLVSKIGFGTINPSESIKPMIDTMTNKINGLLGTTPQEILSITRADTAIPVMTAFSAVFANSEKTPFNADTFKKAWVASNALSNHLQNSKNNILEAVKRFM